MSKWQNCLTAFRFEVYRKMDCTMIHKTSTEGITSFMVFEQFGSVTDVAFS